MVAHGGRARLLVIGLAVALVVAAIGAAVGALTLARASDGARALTEASRLLGVHLHARAH